VATATAAREPKRTSRGIGDLDGGSRRAKAGPGALSLTSEPCHHFALTAELKLSIRAAVAPVVKPVMGASIGN
jgi:hypothetical protein